jgi:hypothetical protein
VWGYAPSYVIGAGISALALPPLYLSRRQNMRADSIRAGEEEVEPQSGDGAVAQPAVESELG